MLRLRAGNLSKHSAFFYKHLEDAGFVTAIIELLEDPDPSTRKFACFAVGNAAFHSDALYAKFASAIAPIVKLLADGNPKTRLNAVGALGNMVRSGEQLVPRLLETGAVRVRITGACIDICCAETCDTAYAGTPRLLSGWKQNMVVPVSGQTYPERETS